MEKQTLFVRELQSFSKTMVKKFRKSVITGPFSLNYGILWQRSSRWVNTYQTI